MKRRSSEANPKDPSRTWSHARRSSLAIRSSDNRFDAATSRGNKDNSCRKRVKFTDIDSDNPLGCRPDAYSIPSEGTRATRSDDPKTSEYAFFKQLKEDAGQRIPSQSVYKERNIPNKLRSSYCSKEKTNIDNSDHCDYLRSSLHDKNISPINFDSFLSPVVSASKNSEVSLKTASTMLGNICRMQENIEGYTNAFKPGGTENSRVDVFSRKRQKLFQWVMDTSLPEIELCSNRCNLVSVLLGRLFPKSNEDNSFKPPKSGQVDTEAKSKLVDSPESDIHFKKLHQITGNFKEVDCGQLLEDGLSSYWSDRSREKVLSDSDSPVCHANKAHHQHIRREPDYGLGRGRALISCTEINSDFDFPFEKYGSFPLCHIEELHDSHNPNGYLLERERQALLLGWDFDDMTKENNFSNTCQNLKLITYPSSPTLWGDDHQQRLDDGFAANGLSTSSSFPNCSSNFHSDLHAELVSSHSHDYGRHILGENEHMVAELNHFPLTLLNGPFYLNLDEHCNYNNTYKGSPFSRSPQDHNWFMGRVLCGRHYPGTEPFLLSSGRDIDSGWKCSSITEAGSSREFYSSTSDDLQFPRKEGISLHFPTGEKCVGFLDDSVHRDAANCYSNDILNIHDLSTFYFQTSLNRERACPLLLDKSSWDGSEGGKSVDVGEFEYF